MASLGVDTFFGALDDRDQLPAGKLLNSKTEAKASDHASGRPPPPAGAGRTAGARWLKKPVLIYTYIPGIYVWATIRRKSTK